MVRFFRITAVASFIVGFLLRGSTAMVTVVPRDYLTIQEALDMSGNRDTVLVMPGEYIENISFGGRNIILVGSPEDPSQTIINGGGEGGVVKFDHGETSAALISGFTITNGNDRGGGGIGCLRSDPRLANLIITGNSAYQGGGVYSYYANITLTNVVVLRNSSTSWGGAIQVEGGQRVEMKNVLVAKNECGEGYVAGINLYNVERTYLTNVTIADNAGGGNDALQISASRTSMVTNVTNCIVWGSAEILVDFELGGSNILNVNYSDVRYDIYPNGPSATVNMGEGCINSEPLFVDSENDNYHLAEDSPCIDTGDPDSDLDPDGSRADMGAYYFDHGNSVANDQISAVNVQLVSIYPNPFNSSTTITFPVGQVSKRISLTIHDLSGRLVADLTNSAFHNPNSAFGTVVWNAEGIPAGVYLIKFTQADDQFVKVIAIAR